MIKNQQNQHGTIFAYNILKLSIIISVLPNPVGINAQIGDNTYYYLIPLALTKGTDIEEDLKICL